MQAALSRLSHVLLAINQNPNLIAHLPQSTENLEISICEPQNRVRNVRLPTKVLDQILESAKVVPWHSREEMVDGLEL